MDLKVTESNTNVEENHNDQSEELEAVTLMDIDFAPLIPNKERSYVELPKFSGENYFQWKFQMKQFIQTYDLEMWRTIKEEPLRMMNEMYEWDLSD